MTIADRSTIGDPLATQPAAQKIVYDV